MIQMFLLSAGSVKTDQIIIIVAAVLVGLGLLFWGASYVIASYLVYTKTLKRLSKDQWGRSRSSDIDEYVRMDDIGMKWHEKYAEYKKDVHIVNDGLNLYGEYYNFGSENCVVFLSGRTESLRYGYYFAKPYSDIGVNVLLIDVRAHGLSDGNFNTVGFEESGDALAWAKYLHDEEGVRSIVFHGICIGSAGAMYALTSENCPDYIKGMIGEGMFINFGESMKNHLRERKKPVFIFYEMINFWMKHYTGHSMNKGPIDCVDRFDKSLLMIHSREDIYSLPQNAQILFDRAPTSDKKIVWYDHGKHSMLRLGDTEKYDNAVKDFIQSVFL